MTDKIALRSNLRATRSGFVAQLTLAQRLAYETELALNLLAHIGEINGKAIASYAALGDEISPGVADRLVSAAGGLLLYPRVGEDRLTLSFHQCARSDLQPGYKAILEPPANAPQLRPEFVLVPLVGVERSGNRIGQGAGHYDRALRALRAGTVQAIGLAWDVQITEQFAADTWDQPLDALITPSVALVFTN